MLRNRAQRWSLVIGIIVLHTAVLVYNGVAFIDLLKYCLSILCFTMVPGLLILKLCRLYEDDSYRFALAFALGICLDIVIYIILSILQARVLVYPIFIIILMLFIFKINIKAELYLLGRSLQSLSTRHMISLIISALLFLFIVVALQFNPNPLPGSGEAVIYYVDQPWHLGNIAEIKNHWYPQDPRLAGSPFHYHIFVYIFTVFIGQVSGLPLPILFFRLIPCFLLYLLFFTVYFTGSRWFNSRTSGILHVVIFFFWGTALLSYPFNIFLINLFTSPTFLLAALLTLFLMIELRSFLAQTGPGNIVLIGLLILGISGAKGNFMPVLICGLLGCWIYRVLLGDEHRRLGKILITAVSLFALVFAYIYRGTGSEGIRIVPFEIVYYTRFFEAYQGHLAHFSGTWLLLSFIPLYFFAFFSFRALALLEFTKKLLHSIKRMPLDSIFLVGVIIASLISGYILGYKGRSEYFYLFVGYICLNLISAGYLLEVFRRRRTIITIIVLVFVVASTVDTFMTINKLHEVVPELKAAEYKPLTPDLYDAMCYLRDNSEKDSVIAAHRPYIYADDNPAFFYYSAFSERRLLVEGWKFMSPAYQEEARRRYADMDELYTTKDAEKASAILDKYSIDFVIMDKLAGQNLWFDTSRLLIRKFQNGEVEIFETVK